MKLQSNHEAGARSPGIAAGARPGPVSVWMLAVCLGGLVVSLTGCAAGNALRARADTIAGQVESMRFAGYKCAPRDLALADAHLAFARQEMDDGEYFRAKEHMSQVDMSFRKIEAVAKKPECLPVYDRDEDGIPDNVDQCPDEPEDFDGFQDVDGCPDPDNDGDGIPDHLDQCPNEPEDKDGYQDEDGCPDPDNDGDGVLDGVDQCPNDPEDFDGFQDADGCPDPDNDSDGIPDIRDKCPNEPGVEPDGCAVQYKSIVIRVDKIELKQMVFFATAKARILPPSFGMLNEIALALRDNPTIKVRIEGHTDSRGARGYNVKLSQQRADSVRRYLIGQGVSPDRMESRGFGPDQPIDDNRTEEGRAANRRVEFVITSR